MKRIAKVLPLIALLSCGQVFTQAETPATLQQTPARMAADLGVTLPKRPWHVADLWWEFQDQTEHFESFSMDVTIDRDVPDSCNLYIAPVGVANMNGMQFYGGLQSNVNGWATRKSRVRVHPGKGAIFSRWSNDKKQPIGLDHARTADGGLCESAGYEGSFCSVRRPFEWTKGTYTYSIIKGDTQTTNTQTRTWFHCLVRSHGTDMTTYVGSLCFDGREFTFWNRHAAFVEVYATSKIPKSLIPEVSVTFGYPRLNGKRPALKKAYVNYNPSGSPSCAKARVDGTSVVVDVGALFRRSAEHAVQELPIDKTAIE